MARYTETEARAAIAASTNWSQALRLLGLRAAGGNHRVLRRWASTWGIATDHFTPYAHVGTHLQKQRIEAILVEGSSYTRSALKQRLYEAGLKTRACEACGQGELLRGLRMSLILTTSTACRTTTGS